MKAVSGWKVACALECEAGAETGPDRRHDLYGGDPEGAQVRQEREEIVVGVVGYFSFSVSLADTFGPPEEER